MDVVISTHVTITIIHTEKFACDHLLLYAIVMHAVFRMPRVPLLYYSYSECYTWIQPFVMYILESEMFTTSMHKKRNKPEHFLKALLQF